METEISQKKQKKPRLTKKQKGFIRDYIKTESATQAALSNYDIKSKTPELVAAVIGNENLNKPYIAQAIAEALPDELLAKVHLEGLQATKRSGIGGMKIGIGTDGKVNDLGHTEIDEPDYAVRHKYLDSAYKIKGTYAPEKSVSLNIQTITEDNPEIAKLRQEFDSKAKELIVSKIKNA